MISQQSISTQIIIRSNGKTTKTKEFKIIINSLITFQQHLINKDMSIIIMKLAIITMLNTINLKIINNIYTDHSIMMFKKQNIKHIWTWLIRFHKKYIIINQDIKKTTNLTNHLWTTIQIFNKTIIYLLSNLLILHLFQISMIINLLMTLKNNILNLWVHMNLLTSTSLIKNKYQIIHKIMNLHIKIILVIISVLNHVILHSKEVITPKILHPLIFLPSWELEIEIILTGLDSLW